MKTTRTTRVATVGFLVAMTMILGTAAPAWAGPGILQLATRSGFWATDFPDGPLFLQHIYSYHFDQIWDGNGHTVDIPDSSMTAAFSRLIGVSHFGDRKQYQFVIEGILPFYNFSMEASSPGAGDNFSRSGVGHPFIYTALGWHTPSKNTHWNGYVAVQVPVGDDDIMNVIGHNAWALLPGVSLQQRFGAFQIEGSIAYWLNSEDLDSDARGNNYFEANVIGTLHLGTTTPWWIYLQADYTDYQASRDGQGHHLDDSGYNWALAPGVGVAVRPNITIDVKFAFDIDGESTSKGRAVNLRVLWKF